jgi:3-deoxy-D-arabino-heptulosonate 7-phosphate (DAHP) synthase
MIPTSMTRSTSRKACTWRVSLLCDIVALGLPVSTEALDPITPQYLQDLIAWSAIGARTTESQTHREMASGLSSAVGFKNGTDGSLTVAVNALKSASRPHRFLGINSQGQVSVFDTRGNRLWPRGAARWLQRAPTTTRCTFACARGAGRSGIADQHHG